MFGLLSIGSVISICCNPAKQPRLFVLETRRFLVCVRRVLAIYLSDYKTFLGMFKKKDGVKRQLKNVRKRPESEGEDSDPNETSTQILLTKKKRKLLTDIQYKRGVGAVQLLRNAIDTTMERSERRDPEFESNEASKEGILERKHKQAMEAYIREKTGAGADLKEELKLSTASGATSLTEEELYKELAQRAIHMVGRTAVQSEKSGDVGSGGAVLVAGTGIAEVILPINERLQTAVETENARDNHQFRESLPAASSVASLPGRFLVPSNRSHSSGVSQRLVDVNGDTSTSPTNAPAPNHASKDETPQHPDEERLGFEALRKGKDGSALGRDTQKQTRRRDRASDDRVYKQFVARERDQKRK